MKRFFNIFTPFVAFNIFTCFFLLQESLDSFVSLGYQAASQTTYKEVKKLKGKMKGEKG